MFPSIGTLILLCLLIVCGKNEYLKVSVLQRISRGARLASYYFIQNAVLLLIYIAVRVEGLGQQVVGEGGGD
jgi:hypothetical protein